MRDRVLSVGGSPGDTTAIDRTLPGVYDQRHTIYVDVNYRPSERYPPYHRLDLRLSRSFQTRSGQIAAFVEAVNLYDRGKVHTYGYRWEQGADRSWRLVTQPEYWFRLLPSLGFTWGWDM